MRFLILLVLLVPCAVLAQVKPGILSKDSIKVITYSDTSKNKQGLYKFYYSNGQLFEEGDYVDNKREGLWQTHWENGNLKEETVYENDKANGYYRVYTDGGKLRGAGYKKYDVLDGIYFVLDTAGNNVCRMVWDLGVLKREDIYDPNVKPEGTEDTINGVRYIWQLGEQVREDALPKSKMPYTGILLK